MDMQTCRLIVAANIIQLRTKAGLTQTELGEKLSYSDKSVSKWECGAAVPDVLVLKNMADLFGVSVDYFLSEHGQADTPDGMPLYKADPLYASITSITLIGVWTGALLLFVLLHILDIEVPWYDIFAVTLTLSFVLLLVFNSVWFRGKHNMLILMGLVFSLFLLFFVLFLPAPRIGGLFLVLVPAEIIVFLAFRIHKHAGTRRQQKKA